MSVLAGSRYPFVKWEAVGQKVKGRIVEVEEVQETYEGVKRTFPKNGQPIMGLNVTLELTPGDDDSRVILGIQGKRMKDAVRDAIKASGAAIRDDQDLVGSDLGVQFTGKDGNARTFIAELDYFDPFAG